MGSRPAFAALALAVISLAIASLLFIDMQTLRASQHSLGSSIARLGNKLRSLELSVTRLSKALAAERKRVEGLETGLMKLDRSLSLAKQSFETKLKEVKSYVSGVARELRASIMDSVRKLNESLENVNATLSLSVLSLVKALNYTLAAERLLSQRVTSLSLSIVNNSEHLKKLYAETEKLNRELASVSERVSLVNTSLVELRKNLATRLMKLETSIAVSDQRYFYASKSYLTKVLESVVKERTVEELALRLGLEGNMTQRAVKVFTFIENNLAYCHDPYAPIVLVNGSIYIAKDLLELPNETIARGCGDCEDLALLAYALLAATKRSGESFYLIFIAWKHSKVGHVALLAIDRVHHIALILDPAGNWLNGIEAQVMMFVENITGAHFIIWLWPLGLSNYTKIWLEHNNFALLTYKDLASGKHMLRPRIHIYNPYMLVAAWLKAWGKPVKRIDVYGIGIHKSFRTGLDFAAWIQSQLYS